MTRHGYVFRCVRGHKCTSIAGNLKGQSEKGADDVSCDRARLQLRSYVFSKQYKQKPAYSLTYESNNPKITQQTSKRQTV